MKSSIFVAVVLLAMGACSCVKATPGITFDQLVQLNGVTFCWNDNPHSYIDGSLTGTERLDVTTHEAIHRRQIRNMGSCKKWDNLFDIPIARFTLEAEAYKGGWCVSAQQLADTVLLRRDYIKNLSLLIPKLDTTIVRAVFDSVPCPSSGGE